MSIPIAGRLNVATACLLTGCASGMASGRASDGDRPPASALASAAVDLVDVTGAPKGTARLTQDSAGTVAIDVTVRQLPPGAHGIHVHAVGACSGTAFDRAGPHFDPSGKQHGLSNPSGPHVGDLPNLVVNADGTGRAVIPTGRLTLTPGPLSIMDADGAALIIHASADDQVTDPSGNSGARIACGVIRAAR